MGNPYMGNSFLEGVGGFMAGQAAKRQQEQAKAAAAYQRQRQQAIDTADIGYKNAQTQYVGAQAEDIPEARKTDNFKAASENIRTYFTGIGKFMTDAAQQDDPRAQAIALRAMKALQDAGVYDPSTKGLPSWMAGGSPSQGGNATAPPAPQGQSTLYGTGPLGTPLNTPSPMGGNAGDLGGPAHPANMGSGNLGGPATPANMGSGNLGGPPAPSGPPRPPFTGMMQSSPQAPQGDFWQQNVAVPTGRSLLDGLANLPGLEWNAPAPVPPPGGPPQGQPMARPQGPGAPLVQPVNAPPQVQGGVTRYPYRTPSGEVLYATRDEANGAIDWSKQQPYQDKVADVELLRSAGKTSANDAWDPYYVTLARSLKGATPEARLQEFESAVARSGRKIVKFPSDASDYQQFAQSQGVNTGQTQQGQPQQPANGKIFSLSPEDKVAMSKIPLNEAETRNADARTAQIKATIGDPFPFLKEIGKYTQPGAQAIATQKWNESHGTNFGIPGKDFPGTYSLNSEEAMKQLDQQSQIHARNTNTVIAPLKARAEINHLGNQDIVAKQNADTQSAAQRATATHYGNQDTNTANRLNFDRDKYNAFSPEKQAYITSQQKRLAATQAVITKAQEDINHALASPITPIAQKVIIDLAMSRKQAAEAQQKTIQADIDRQFGGGQQQPSGVVGANPNPPSVIDNAIQACKATGAGNNSHCGRLARITMEKIDPANAALFDRRPDASARTTLANFQRAGKAFSYNPSIKLPPGSLVFSTKLGGKDGHVAVIGSDGSPNDQYGKDHFAKGDFNFYVPPSGGGRQKQTASAGKAISGRAPSGVNFTYTP